MKAEIVRRQHGAREVLALFRQTPETWIPWTDFAAIAACAWRTRISDARKVVERDGGVIEWNKSVKASAYRYRPQQLGRDAGERIAGGWLFDVHQRG